MEILTSLFLKGSLIGLSLALPLGPVGILCIQHTLRRGMIPGIIAGLGAALADALLSFMGIFGISLLTHFVTRYQIFFQIFGSLVLWIVGIKMYRTHPPLTLSSPAPRSLKRIFLSTFGLTLSNPLTLLGFAALYAGLGISIPNEETILPGVILIFGVFFGAAVWLLVLTLGVFLIGKKYQFQSSSLLNRITGTVLTGFGFLTGLSALRQLLF